MPPITTVWQFLWGLWGLWKPVACVTSMHFFHHFAIWLTQYSYEDVMAVMKEITNDPVLRTFLPYSITWLFNRARSDFITWWGWVGYRFREEAQLWWLVDEHDRKFEAGFLKYAWADAHPRDKHIQADYRNFMRTFDQKVLLRAFSDPSIWKEKTREEIIYKEKEWSGYEGITVDDQTGPTRPQQEPRIRFHNPDRSYPEGKPHYYYADPEYYYRDQVAGNLRDVLQEQLLERQSQRRRNVLHSQDGGRHGDDLTDDDDMLEYNKKDMSINGGLFGKLGKGPQQRAVRNNQDDQDNVDSDGLTRTQKKNRHQAKVRAAFDADTRTYSEGVPRKTLYRDKPLPDTADYLWPDDGEDPLDYI